MVGKSKKVKVSYPNSKPKTGTPYRPLIVAAPPNGFRGPRPPSYPRVNRRNLPTRTQLTFFSGLV